MRRREAVLSVVLWPAALAAAQPASRKMTNADVIALTKAGISPDLIVEKIHAAGSTDFDTGVDGLKALQSAQVAPAVIRMMINPGATGPVNTYSSPATAATSDPDLNDPGAQHSPGIYIYALTASGHQMTELQHARIKETKGSGAWLSGVTYGIKKYKIKGVLDGPSAPVKTADPNPAFYLYIPVNQTSFGGSGLAANDFTLVKFTPKNGAREIVEGSGSIWGSSMGTDDKAKQGFTVEPVKPGISKLSLLRPLPPGQYGLAQNRGMFFDFDILPAE